MKCTYLVIPVFFGFGLTGCSSESGQTATDDVIATHSTNTQIAEPDTPPKSSVPADAPTYKIAMSGKQPPFNFIDEYGDFRGIDVDIMRAVGEIEGFNVEFQKEPYAEIFQTIDDGVNDVLFGGLAYNEERAIKYAVSDSYLFVPSAIMYVKTNNTINDVSNVEGLRYAGVPITLQTKYFLELYPDNEYVETESTFLAFEKLIRDEVDFIAEDLQFLNYLKLRYPEYDLAIMDYQTEDDPTSQQIALARKDNAHLIDKINNGFEVMQSSGEITRIEEKWLE